MDQTCDAIYTHMKNLKATTINDLGGAGEIFEMNLFFPKNSFRIILPDFLVPPAEVNGRSLTPYLESKSPLDRKWIQVHKYHVWSIADCEKSDLPSLHPKQVYFACNCW